MDTPALKITSANAATFAGTLAAGATTLSGVMNIPTATPASGGAGTAGDIAWDASYIYVCTATDTWERAALTGGY